MKFQYGIEIDVEPVAAKTYRKHFTRKSITETLYIVDEPDRFIYYHIRTVSGKEPEYLQQAVAERLRRGTGRYNSVIVWAYATAEPGEEIPDKDLLLFCGAGKDPPKLVNLFDQEEFDNLITAMRNHSDSIRKKF